MKIAYLGVLADAENLINIMLHHKKTLMYLAIERSRVDDVFLCLVGIHWLLSVSFFVRRKGRSTSKTLRYSSNSDSVSEEVLPA